MKIVAIIHSKRFSKNFKLPVEGECKQKNDLNVLKEWITSPIEAYPLFYKIILLFMFNVLSNCLNYMVKALTNLFSILKLKKQA